MVEGPGNFREDGINHCQVKDIKICTRCGSKNIKIQGDSITCNDCNAILCYEHQNSENEHD